MVELWTRTGRWLLAEISAVVGAALLFAPAPAALAANPDLSASHARYVVEDQDRNGEVSRGDVIVYTITLANRGTEPALDVVVTAPIPLGSRFIRGSIRWNGENVLDVDGYSSGPPRIALNVSSLPPGRAGDQVVQFKVMIATGREEVDSIRSEPRVKARGIPDFWLPAVNTPVVRAAAEPEAAPSPPPAVAPVPATPLPSPPAPAAVPAEPELGSGGLPKVRFALNSTEIRLGSHAVLDSVVRLLAAEPDVHLMVVGYSDAGAERGDLRLSLDRAKEVKDYLVAKGADASRIHTLGRGGAEPVAPGAADSGAASRRVEFELFGTQ